MAEYPIQRFCATVKSPRHAIKMHSPVNKKAQDAVDTSYLQSANGILRKSHRKMRYNERMKILFVLALFFLPQARAGELKIGDCFAYPKNAYKPGDPMAGAVWKIAGMVEDQYQVRSKTGQEKWGVPQLLPSSA